MNSQKSNNFRSFGLGISTSLAAILLSLIIASLILLISGSNPLQAYWDLIERGVRIDIIFNILNRAMPLYVSAIAVAIGFRMNLFNIGVEGQYAIAAIIAAQVGAKVGVDLPGFLGILNGPIHILIILLTAMAVGAAWAGIAGVLKVTSGIHEVISTIMLNAISGSFLIALLLKEWKLDDEDIFQTATIPKSGRLPALAKVTEPGTAVLSSFLIIALIVGVAYWIYVYKTRPGFDLRASGMNPLAAQASGVSPVKTILIAMLLSGAIAGLVGMPELLGPAGKPYYHDSFVGMLGFNGIAVALLGQNHPGGIALSALFISFIDTTSIVLDANDSTPKEIIDIMIGIIIFVMVIAFGYSKKIREANEAKQSALVLAKNGSSPPT